MINKKVNILIAFFIAAVFILPQIVHAAYELSNVSVEGVSTGSKPQMVPETDLVTTIKAPTPPVGGSLQYYVYKWNNSSTPLTETELSPATESRVYHGDTIIFNTDRTLFAESNFDNNPIWYLHVKTFYSTSESPINISNDKVVGPFTFDNVPPFGEISLAAVEGQTDNTTTLNPVILTVTAQDTVKVFINSSTSFDAAKGVVPDSSNNVKYNISEPGEKTLYAWFQDEAGNVTAKPDYFPLTFTYFAGKSMDPAGDLTLGVNKTQVFTINGAGAETFNWSIVDAAGNAATGAEFSGTSQGVATVTVKGVTEDAQVYVKAESIPVGTTYPSGMIKIVKSGPDFNLDVDNDGKADAATDGLLIVRYLFGLNGTTLINKALSGNALRTDPKELVDYLDAGKLSGALDVDNDGKSDAATDGLLIVRYLFGLNGTTLINKALSGNATRTDPDDIVDYLTGLK